jgi:hypothetical protein
MPARSNARASLCSFTFSDGRHCRTPRSPKHPHLCYFHARREAQSLAAEDLGRDIAYFFSGKYLSACDLNAALGRLFAAVAQGLVNRHTARTLAYLAQTISQTIRITQNEYAQSLGGDAWRNSVRTSVNANFDYITPESPSSNSNSGSNSDSNSSSAPDSAPNSNPDPASNPAPNSSPSNSATNSNPAFNSHSSVPVSTSEPAVSQSPRETASHAPL